jgi:hypothetical protein
MHAQTGVASGTVGALYILAIVGIADVLASHAEPARNLLTSADVYFTDIRRPRRGNAKSLNSWRSQGPSFSDFSRIYGWIFSHLAL